MTRSTVCQWQHKYRQLNHPPPHFFFFSLIIPIPLLGWILKSILHKPRGSTWHGYKNWWCFIKYLVGKKDKGCTTSNKEGQPPPLSTFLLRPASSNSHRLDYGRGKLCMLGIIEDIDNKIFEKKIGWNFFLFIYKKHLFLYISETDLK